nr:hypothetical protein [Tanacetum cinerariifolium]
NAVTLEDKRECNELICENSSTIDVCDNHSEILFDSNNDDLSSDDESFKDIEYVDASVSNPAIVSIEEKNGVEEENVVQREEEEKKSIYFFPVIQYHRENVADDPEGDICFLKELLIDDSIL